MDLQDPRFVAAIGGIAIGLIASGILYLMRMRRVKIARDRRSVRVWTLAFTISICTFTAIVPLLDSQFKWVILLPLLGMSLALVTLHRISSSSAGAAG